MGQDFSIAVYYVLLGVDHVIAIIAVDFKLSVREAVQLRRSSNHHPRCVQAFLGLYSSCRTVFFSLQSLYLGQNQLGIVDLHVFDIFWVTFETFDLIDLVQIHLILGHGVPAFESPFLALKVVDLFQNRFWVPVSFNLSRDAVSAVFFENLFSG